jgi:hypothetical protein
MSEEVNDTSIPAPETPVIGTAIVDIPQKTAAEYQKELNDQAALIANLTRKMRDIDGRAKSMALQAAMTIMDISQDPELKDHPLVVKLVEQGKEQGNLQTQVNDYNSNIEAQTVKLKELAAEAAPIVLPTLKDKTLLRNGDNKAVVTVAEKLKVDNWNPVQAFQYADSNPATKHYVIRQIDEKRFKEDVEKGFVTPPPGVYDFHIDYEVRIMKDGLSAL